MMRQLSIRVDAKRGSAADRTGHRGREGHVGGRLKRARSNMALIPGKTTPDAKLINDLEGKV